MIYCMYVYMYVSVSICYIFEMNVIYLKLNQWLQPNFMALSENVCETETATHIQIYVYFNMPHFDSFKKVKKKYKPIKSKFYAGELLRTFKFGQKWHIKMII